MKKHLLALIAAAGLLTACSSAIDANGYTYDPWEPFNRKVFVFNDTLDTYLLKPLATGYDTITPGPVKKGVSNFFGNLGDVGSFANSLLQLKFRQSLQILARVIDNTVYGLGGLIDVATPMGNPKIHEDFGTTLAHYGVNSGPFLMLPLFGPSTVRDGFGRVVDTAATPQRLAIGDHREYWTLTAINGIQTRAQLLPLEKVATDQPTDKYTLVRDTWLQYRFGQVTGEQRSAGEQKALDDIFEQEQHVETQ